MKTDPEENNNEPQMQQKYMQFQILQQQIEQINQHVEMLNDQINELDISVNAIEELGKSEVDKEILAPVANGIFLKGMLKDNQKLVVNVGSDITVEKTIPEVVKLLEEQKGQVSNKLIEADTLLQEFTSQAMKIYQEVEESVK